MRLVTTAVIMAAVLTLHQPASAQDDPIETRPANATFWGDTGLWFVPTAETPRAGGMSFSLYRTEFDFSQGFTNVSYWPVTASVGIGDRVELFGSLRMVTRIDRDARPLFFSDPEDGGLVNDYPFVREQFTGNDLGDLFAGAKLNLSSQSRNQTLGFALRGTVKFPTADDESGAGTGKFDAFGDAIISKEIGNVELTGFGGVVFRTDPDAVSLSDSLRWGVGAGFGGRGNFRVTTELWGEQPFDDAVQLKQPASVTGDGSVIPVFSPIDSAVNTSIGLTFQGKGMSFGAGLTYHMSVDRREDVFPNGENVMGDVVSLQFRLGFHQGVKVYRAPPVEVAATPPPPPPPAVVVAPAPAPAPPPAPAINNAPILLAVCEPCQVEVGKTITVRATGQDADGDRLTYRWTVASGTIANPAAAVTNWTAGTVTGQQVLTVTAEDGRGGAITGRVNVEVVAATAFADIVFDVNRDVLRPDALVILQNVTAALRANPTLRLQIEGHTSAEGTAEFNLALGERRAIAVRSYLISQGIDGGRLTSVTYGEERPRFDDTSESSRALNRRAAFVVREP